MNSHQPSTHSHDHQADELRVASVAWESAVRAMTVDNGQIGLGLLRRHNTACHRQWLADDLTLQTKLPSGANYPALSDWCVLTVDGGRSARDLLVDIKPLASQGVVVVVLRHDGVWDGVVHEDGVVRPLDTLQVVGSGELRLDRTNQSYQPDEHQRARHSRTAGALGDTLFRRVADANVLVVGCGRNGSLTAWMLAGIGVGRLTLVDADNVELHNLDAMPGLSVVDVGRCKAIAVAERLHAFRPEMNVRAIPRRFTEALGGLRDRYDLVVTTVDSDAARLAASWYSRNRLVTHLDIGTVVVREDGDLREDAGDIRLIAPFEGCVRCVGGVADEDASFYELAAPANAMLRGDPPVWSDQRAGSLVTNNAVTVGAAIELWLDFLDGRCSSTWLRLHREQGRERSFDRVPTSADAGCDCVPASVVRSNKEQT